MATAQPSQSAPLQAVVTPPAANAARVASGLLAVLAGAALFLGAEPAMAYIGPGAGISMLGALWGVVVAVALAIGAILFYPIRALLRRGKAPARVETATTPHAAVDAKR